MYEPILRERECVCVCVRKREKERERDVKHHRLLACVRGVFLGQLRTYDVFFSSEGFGLGETDGSNGSVGRLGR